MDAKYKCVKCGREYGANEIRFSGANKLECVYCLGVKTHSEPQPSVSEKSDKPKEEMVEYVCTNCNYAFKRKRSFAIKACPYCNKEGMLTLKSSKNANNLLNDSMDKKFEF